MKQLHKTFVTLACINFAIITFSFSAGANVIAERDLLVNSSLLGVDQNFQGRKFSTAAILSSGAIGYFLGLDYLREHMSWGGHIYCSSLPIFIQGDPKVSFAGYIKFKFNNNFYLDWGLGMIADSTNKLSYLSFDKNGKPNIHPNYPIGLYEYRILLGKKISIGENCNFITELSNHIIHDAYGPFTVLLNLNLGLNFKIREFHIETRFSNFINFVDIKDPAFTISANKDISWASLSFGAKTNLNFEAKNIMGFVQATFKF